MTNTAESDVNIQCNKFLKGVFNLLSAENVDEPFEALSVFLHACMLEVGFFPANVDEREVYQRLPEDWKANGAWKFHYCHKQCVEFSCWVTCVPLYSYLAVQGTLETDSNDNIYKKFKIYKYIKEGVNVKDSENLFVDEEKLKRKFKDEFCYPLLALLQEKAGCNPSFGFSITVDEIKLYILKLLPVQSIVALSSVNQDFNRVANSNFLWKYLLERDFGLIDIPANTSEEEYKELYKREYLKKKQRARRFTPLADPYHFSAIVPSGGPPFYVDPRRDMDPALQQVFPHLRDRFRPNWIYPPYEYLNRFF